MKSFIQIPAIAFLALSLNACNEPSTRPDRLLEDTSHIAPVPAARVGNVWKRFRDSPCIFVEDSTFNCNSPQCQAFLCDTVHAITEQEFITRVEDAHSGTFPPAPELTMTRAELKALLKPVNCAEYHLELQQNESGNYQLVPVAGAKPGDYNSSSLSVAYVLGVMQLRFDTLQFYWAKTYVESVALRANILGPTTRTYYGDLTELVPITDSVK